MLVLCYFAYCTVILLIGLALAVFILAVSIPPYKYKPRRLYFWPVPTYLILSTPIVFIGATVPKAILIGYIVLVIVCIAISVIQVFHYKKQDKLKQDEFNSTLT